MKTEDINISFYKAENGLGKIIVYESNISEFSLKNFILENKSIINKKLLEYGGILFRNFSVDSISEFNNLSKLLLNKQMEYMNRSTPRRSLGGKIYTATEYPSDRYIPFHNENSYTLNWPQTILFYCAVAAKEGGETPIADSRNVYKHIDNKIVEKFNKYKVLYVRNYISGIDLPWQEVFQTNKKDEVEEYCKNNKIGFKWGADKIELTTKQICQASVLHPQTKEPVWFNQAHLFNSSRLETDIFKKLVYELGEGNITRESFYGNGDKIERKVLEYIKASYEKERIEFKWKRNDVLLLDNLLMSHSRNPFKGPRKIAVAMGS